MLQHMCNSCKQTIPPDDLYWDVYAALKRSDLEESQDPVGAQYGDYCQPCAETGAALAHLLKLYKTRIRKRKR